MRYAVVDKNTNKVINVVLWDGRAEWKAPEGTYLIESQRANIDDVYNPETSIFSIAVNGDAIPIV